MPSFSLVECPRDAMQGWPHFIPTEQKIEYLNQLLKVGFDVLDFGSFVSAKAIPQLADTKEVVEKLDMSNTKTKLLAIVANTRGAEEALQYDIISYIGFPLSISETFQKRNTNKTIAEAMSQVAEMQQLCVAKCKKLVVYISMGFGNPYGDAYTAEIAIDCFKQLNEMGIEIVAMADTVGVADPQNIEYIYSNLIPKFPEVTIGAHFHSTITTWEEKIQAAYDNGCLRFDSSIKGIGGCPMAEDDLVGNIATENIVQWAERNNIELGLNKEAFAKAMQMANEIFV